MARFELYVCINANVELGCLVYIAGITFASLLLYYKITSKKSLSVIRWLWKQVFKKSKLAETKVPADALNKDNFRVLAFKGKTSTEGVEKEGVAGQFDKEALLEKFDDKANVSAENSNEIAENDGGGSNAGAAEQYKGGTNLFQSVSKQEMDENPTSIQAADTADDSDYVTTSESPEETTSKGQKIPNKKAKKKRKRKRITLRKRRKEREFFPYLIKRAKRM